MYKVSNISRCSHGVLKLSSVTTRDMEFHPPSQAINAAATQTGHVSGTTAIPFDEAYLYPVSVGGQTLMLDFDTGSADLWVFSTKLPAAQQGTHKLYNPAISGTDLGETWDISYVDGTGEL